MVIVLDPGHGASTPGKRSPDGTLLEYQYNRKIALAVKKELESLGYTVYLTVSDNSDPSLSKRCAIVNNYCAKYGKNNVMMVSIHVNAAGGDGKWHSARDWSVFVAKVSSQNSKIMANCLADATIAEGIKIRKPLPNQKYWTANFAMVKNTNCPAVLTENLFQDNKEDVAFLLSEQGTKKIVNLHVRGIIDYIEKIK